MKLKQIMNNSDEVDAELDNLQYSPDYDETPNGINARNILTELELK